jgi:hypothetical protein
LLAAVFLYPGGKIIFRTSKDFDAMELDCLAAHLQNSKILKHNYCTICKLKNTAVDKDHLLVCPKLDHTSKELSKLSWDARRLME